MKIKAILLSILFLLTGSGLKMKITTCYNVVSGISFKFKEHDLQKSKECSAYMKVEPNLPVIRFFLNDIHPRLWRIVLMLHVFSIFI